ncbi:hypothetical protein XI05_33865 [Bradyrhizobium sp. CCBAU 11357]|nr:hypothetical protein [Bradyrhizobium sp. CCBAU 11357]
MRLDRATTKVRSLSRLRERVGERVLPQWDNPQEEKALTRAYRATSTASAFAKASADKSGRGERAAAIDST